MSDFSISVVKILNPVEDHPNADRLSLIKIGGYVCISAKLEDGSHRYQQGDLVAYIPESAVLPENILRELGMWDETRGCGISALRGALHNRVKAIRLRGIFSQGILYKPPFEVTEGEDIAERLGIVKYEPTLPAHMAGAWARPRGSDDTKKYDIEALQKQMRLFEPGELVEVTEKIHGTNVQIGYIPNSCNPDWFGDGNLYVTSKGVGARGFALKSGPENEGNVYVSCLNMLIEHKDLCNKLKEISNLYGDIPVRLYGEIYGSGIQDLSYGLSNGKSEFALFDIQVGDYFLDVDAFCSMNGVHLKLKAVPVLFVGEFSLEKMEELRVGMTVAGNNTHIREGIVIKSIYDGRKVAKFVSPDYLLRKDSNATEYA